MQNTKRRRLTVIIVSLLLIVSASLLLARAYGRGSTEERCAAVRSAVQRSAMQCYVIEGAYPSDLGYLTENYGLSVNTDDYRVVYIAFAENLPPEIKVTAAGKN